uniref:Protein kinase domain-containing protein n=1 Tax=Chenopodium quinoa TaxID=63459 RepID=A0A803LZL1_CHEQI
MVKQSLLNECTFFNTTQWAKEFINEVNLIRDIQHKNLVKLLGCSIEGSESPLVYEFMPKKSLDHHLFESELEAKIADFGLVRSIASGRSHLNTGIAGTLGYMAPEYLVQGQLTEKADVYSFGVWNLYRLDRQYECVDSYLGTEFQEEVLKVLQIGLLCTQASVP